MEVWGQNKIISMDRKLYETYQKIEEDHWWFVARRKLIYQLISEFNKKKEDLKILDIGCNSGFLVNKLQEKNYEAYGCDTDEMAVGYGKGRGIKNLKVSSFPALDYPDNSFDVITCLDVLEHVEDDNQALKEINRIIKKDSVIIMTVPAFQFLWGLQDEASHHFRRYSKKELTNKIKNNTDWQVIKKSYFNFLLFFPILFIRKISNILKLKRSSDFDINNNFINKILLIIFSIEIWLLKIISYPFGVSLLVVAKKKQA